VTIDNVIDARSNCRRPSFQTSEKSYLVSQYIKIKTPTGCVLSLQTCSLVSSHFSFWLLLSYHHLQSLELFNQAILLEASSINVWIFVTDRGLCRSFGFIHTFQLSLTTFLIDMIVIPVLSTTLSRPTDKAGSPSLELKTVLVQSVSCRALPVQPTLRLTVIFPLGLEQGKQLSLVSCDSDYALAWNTHADNYHISTGQGTFLLACTIIMYIAHRYTGLCMDLAHGDLSNNNEVLLWICDANNKNQWWQISSLT